MEMTWFDLERLLKKARAAKEKQTGDHYDGVTIDVGVMGPGALNILYCGSDEGMPPLFYVGFKYEDGEMDDQEIGESLKDTVFRYAKSYGVWGDWDESDKKGCDVDEGDIKKLNDIINGQGFLFENLQTMERIAESKKQLNEGVFKSANINFIDFVNKLQQFLDTAAPGMGLEVVEQSLGMGGAYIKIEQRDEEGKTPDDGIVSWMSGDDADAYYDKMADEA